MTKKYYDTGEGKWYYGQPCHYHNGSPSNHLLGPCPICGTSCFDYGGGWRCNALYCEKSFTNPASNVGKEPEWWNEPIKVFRDGVLWCAVYDDFINLQESPAGFGATPRDAVNDLKRVEQ